MIARALPMRPPRARYSSVSTTKSTCTRSRIASRWSTMASGSRPRRARREANRAIMPSPRLTLRLSTTRRFTRSALPRISW
jgi:hypothetical protein